LNKLVDNKNLQSKISWGKKWKRDVDKTSSFK